MMIEMVNAKVLVRRYRCKYPVNHDFFGGRFYIGSLWLNKIWVWFDIAICFTVRKLGPVRGATQFSGGR